MSTLYIRELTSTERDDIEQRYRIKPRVTHVLSFVDSYLARIVHDPDHTSIETKLEQLKRHERIAFSSMYLDTYQSILLDEHRMELYISNADIHNDRWYKLYEDRSCDSSSILRYCNIL